MITPVGPGHEAPSLECAASVSRASRGDVGPFTEITHSLVDDHQGKLGRCRARNVGVLSHPDADWFLFIDADDLCRPDVFRSFAKALRLQPDLVAVFGAVLTDVHGLVAENVYPLTWDGLLVHGASGTLSMGFFCRGDIARTHEWDETIDAGEDFEFYLRVLRGRPWTKLETPLVTIRRSIPSAGGPRGYRSLDWRTACQTWIDKEKQRSVLTAP